MGTYQRANFRGSKGAGRHDVVGSLRMDITGRGQSWAAKYNSEHDRRLADRVKKRNYKIRKSAIEREERYKHIAILDFETDPFDNVLQTAVYPFTCCIHRADYDDIIIWENDYEKFCDLVVTAIEGLPGRYIVYAHNGGKFDWLLLLHKIRGRVSFKGRGLMRAQIGAHELRDSFHIIPEKLANYHKEVFDYDKMKRCNREQHRDEIVRYMRSDCKYLMEIVSNFVYEYGFKLSIGQAALTKLRENYRVKRISEYLDEQLRPYYFGGRVECLQGRGHFIGRRKLYDVNSMYPRVMAECYHPIGNNYTRRIGLPDRNTAFINLNCTNYGAFLARDFEQGCSGNQREGNFLVTIHEFKTALAHGLIEDVDIHWCIDCDEFSTFEKFVLPLYEARQKTKALLRTLPKYSAEWYRVYLEDLFYKLLLNNCYGKFAQNPRRYKESFVTSLGEQPDGDYWGDMPRFENGEYAIWERDSFPWRFFNVGTGASITGAARAVLMDAICRSKDPIYCDTDSLICTDLTGVDIHPTRLGAWDIEAEFDEVLIVGKKTYAARLAGSDEIKVRSKGVALDEARAWQDMKNMLRGENLSVRARAPTISKLGRQLYMQRQIRTTAPDRPSRIFERSLI